MNGNIEQGISPEERIEKLTLDEFITQLREKKDFNSYYFNPEGVVLEHIKKRYRTSLEKVLASENGDNKEAVYEILRLISKGLSDDFKRQHLDVAVMTETVEILLLPQIEADVFTCYDILEKQYGKERIERAKRILHEGIHDRQVSVLGSYKAKEKIKLKMARLGERITGLEGEKQTLERQVIGFRKSLDTSEEEREKLARAQEELTRRVTQYEGNVANLQKQLEEGRINNKGLQKEVIDLTERGRSLEQEVTSLQGGIETLKAELNTERNLSALLHQQKIGLGNNLRKANEGNKKYQRGSWFYRGAFASVAAGLLAAVTFIPKLTERNFRYDISALLNPPSISYVKKEPTSTFKQEKPTEQLLPSEAYAKEELAPLAEKPAPQPEQELPKDVIHHVQRGNKLWRIFSDLGIPRNRENMEKVLRVNNIPIRDYLMVVNGQLVPGEDGLPDFLPAGVDLKIPAELLGINPTKAEPKPVPREPEPDNETGKSSYLQTSQHHSASTQPSQFGKSPSTSYTAPVKHFPTQPHSPSFLNKIKEIAKSGEFLLRRFYDGGSSDHIRKAYQVMLEKFPYFGGSESRLEFTLKKAVKEFGFAPTAATLHLFDFEEEKLIQVAKVHYQFCHDLDKYMLLDGAARILGVNKITDDAYQRIVAAYGPMVQELARLEGKKKEENILDRLIA